jgi:hypothetical protein
VTYFTVIFQRFPVSDEENDKKSYYAYSVLHRDGGILTLHSEVRLKINEFLNSLHN